MISCQPCPTVHMQTCPIGSCPTHYLSCQPCPTVSTQTCPIIACHPSLGIACTYVGPCGVHTLPPQCPHITVQTPCVATGGLGCPTGPFTGPPTIPPTGPLGGARTGVFNPHGGG
jgi:hypothetical protein